MKTKNSVIVLICLSLLAFTLPGFAEAVTLTSDGKVPGKPFEDLQQQIYSLQQQIIQLGQPQIDALQQEVEDLTMELEAIKQDGAYGYQIKRVYKEVTVLPGQVIDIQFDVPAGTRIVGGGARIASPGLNGLTLINSYPSPMTCTTGDYVTSWDWYVGWWKNDTSTTLTGTLEAWAIYIGEELPPGIFYGCN